MSTPLVASNTAALRTPHVQQSLINGRLTGRKGIDMRAASAVSRRNMLAATARVVQLLKEPAIALVLGRGVSKSYEDLKRSELFIEQSESQS